MKPKFTKTILYGYLVIFTIISISSLGYYLDSLNPTVIQVCRNGCEDNLESCPSGQNYNEVLFKCVISCKDDLVYNGYTDSCTTEFELKYHGFCDGDLTYSPSLHVCLGDDSDIQHVPLKDPPRTSPSEPELENEN